MLEKKKQKKQQQKQQKKNKQQQHNFTHVILFSWNQVAATSIQLSHIMRKPVFGVCTRLDVNRPAQLQKLARLLKFWM